MSLFLGSRKKFDPSSLEASFHQSNPFVVVDRQTTQLQRNLQQYLDAQSDGLATGLSQPADDALSSSSTPATSTRSSVRFAASTPTPRPPRKKIGLNGARRGILQTMAELLRVKEEERWLLRLGLEERCRVLEDVDTFKSKMESLDNAVTEISGENQSRIEGLSSETRMLENDIRELETKLLQMKARHRCLVDELRYSQNALDAKLSSYKESLEIVKSSANDYLRSPSVQPFVTNMSDPVPPFYTLNPNRRTLDMAKTQWETERRQMSESQRRVSAEMKALNEGGKVWYEAIAIVTKFESRLREQIRQAGSTPLDSNGGNSGLSIIKELDEAAAELDARLQLAEEKNWNLLLCCIGAELEAFSQARELLLDAFPQTDKSAPSITDTAETHPSNGESLMSTLGAGNSIATQMKVAPPELMETNDGVTNPAKLVDEDDEPDPSWL